MKHSLDYLQYFKTLLNTQVSNSDIDKDILQYVKTVYLLLKRVPIQGPLDYEISETEIYACIKSLKRGKSAGADLILNKMLKVGKDILVKPIHILFNKILSSGEYPKNWDTSIITPIFKGGHSSDINISEELPLVVV